MAAHPPIPKRRSPMEHPRHQYPQETAALQNIARSCGLVEQIKWGKPCFTAAGKNVLLLQPFLHYIAVLFFQGALLDDPQHLLARVGQHTVAARQLRFTSAAEIAAAEPVLRTFITQALTLAHTGAKAPRAPSSSPTALPAELHAALLDNPALQQAFSSLTPGRRRGYILHIAAAKQASTRTARVAKLAPRILAGRGLHD